MKTWGPYLVMIAAMLWATDAPFRLFLTQGLSSNFIVLGEHLVDVLIVLPILVMGYLQLKKLSWRQWIAVAIIAIGGSALASVAFTEAFHYVNPSVAILLQKLQPLIAITLAWLILKEPLAPKFWLWAGLALLGAYIISFPSFIPQLYPGEGFNPNVTGVLLALLAAALWGASTVLGKYVLSTIDFKLMTALRFVGAFIFLLLLNTVQGSFPDASTFTWTDILFIIIVAIASGVVSLFIYYKGLETTNASVATIAELGFPMAAIFVNWLFIPNSNLSAMQFVGVALLLFAIWRLAAYNKEAAAVQPTV